jgi:hypothetical protein
MITESDIEREQRIRTLTDQVVYARDTETRRRRMAELEAEIAARTPAAIAYLEKQLHLVA